MFSFNVMQDPVRVVRVTMCVWCECRMFDFRGVHALCAYKEFNVCEIPEIYVLPPRGVISDRLICML